MMTPPSFKVAIVEDDMSIAQMYRMKFESDGYQVQVAENGELGLQMIEEMRPDIILLDLMMPVMTGGEMLSKLRNTEWGKEIKVIILTNIGKEEAPRSILELDITNFIVKADMTPRQVAELVKQELSAQ